MPYAEDDMLMLSGIQHYVFCPRQWALIHIEQLWEENALTVSGQLLHERVDEPAYRQKNGDTVTLRHVAIASMELGLTGFSDAIELRASDSPVNTIKHPKYAGYWAPMPVEYKHGKIKADRCDEVQVTAQALCLEEMYGIRISQCALYYGEERRRRIVTLDDELREFTKHCAEEMHRIYKNGTTPTADLQPHCKSCSIRDLCMPQLPKKRKVALYLKNNLYEETP